MTKAPLDPAIRQKRQREVEVGALKLYASEVFGSANVAHVWMTAPHPQLDGRTPKGVVLDGGYHRVEKILTELSAAQRAERDRARRGNG